MERESLFHVQYVFKNTAENSFAFFVEMRYQKWERREVADMDTHLPLTSNKFHA